MLHSELMSSEPESESAGHCADPTGPLRVAILTVSDRASAGTYEDRTGPAIEAALGGASAPLDCRVTQLRIVPDEADEISAALIAWCDSGQVDLILTNGGTGLSPRDVTPEATRDVIDVEAPGLAELMRSVGLQHTVLAALSRQVVGRRGATMIVNLPGSTKGALESLGAIAPVIGHACGLAKGEGQ